MALTATCKKCNREVTPGDICPVCGTKLGKNAAHAAWVTERKPVLDWMCWNAVLRWLLPAGLAVLLSALALEWMAGGVEAVEKLFLGSFPVTLLILLGILLVLVLAALLLQGRELMDYVVDSRGVHVTRYLPDPTPLRLLMRLKSPGLMRQVDPGAETPVLRLDSQDLPWREVSRVQLWPEKCYILFYAPVWWLRIPVRCTPFSWDDALSFVREKLGKKKAVDLPAHLRTQSAKSAPAPRRSGSAQAGARPAASRKPAPPPAPEWPDDGDASASPQAERPDGVSASFPSDAAAEADKKTAVPPSEGEQLSLDLSDQI